jgi:hypothetical protein
LLLLRLLLRLLLGILLLLLRVLLLGILLLLLRVLLLGILLLLRVLLLGILLLLSGSLWLLAAAATSYRQNTGTRTQHHLLRNSHHITPRRPPTPCSIVPEKPGPVRAAGYRPCWPG